MPGRSIAGANVREDTIDGIAVRDPALRRPEGEAVVKGIDCCVCKLNGPMRAGVFCLVDAEVSGVVADRHQVCDLLTHALNIAKLQRLSSGDYTGSPGCAAIGCNHIRATGSGRPDALRVDRADRNQQLRGAAFLWSQARRARSRSALSLLCNPKGRGARNREREQQRTLKHISSLDGGVSVVKYTPLKEVECLRPLRSGGSPEAELEALLRLTSLRA